MYATVYCLQMESRPNSAPEIDLDMPHMRAAEELLSMLHA